MQERHLSLRKARRAVTFFMLTTITAILIGWVLAVTIKPGSTFAKDDADSDDRASVDVLDFLFDFIIGLVPESLLVDARYTFHTETTFLDDNGNPTDPENATQQGIASMSVEGPNTLGLIVWAFIFGIVLRSCGEKGKLFIDSLEYINSKIKEVVDLILWYLPIGMVFLVASSVAGITNWDSVSKLGMFILTVIVGLFIQCLVVMAIYIFSTRRNPFSLIRKMSPALVTALLISSSAATLPVTMQVCESNLRIDKKVSRIILPVGTNINKDGTALYEVVAVLFIAQLNSIPLSATEVFKVCVVSLVASIAAPSIPATGAASTRLVLSSVGLPAGDAALLLPVEWVLDRLNTMVNVLGDCFCAEIVHEMMAKDAETDDDSGEERGPSDEASHFVDTVFFDTDTVQSTQ